LGEFVNDRLENISTIPGNYFQVFRSNREYLLAENMMLKFASRHGNDYNEGDS